MRMTGFIVPDKAVLSIVAKLLFAESKNRSRHYIWYML